MKKPPGSWTFDSGRDEIVALAFEASGIRLMEWQKGCTPMKDALYLSPFLNFLYTE